MIASVYVPFFFIESYGIKLGLETDTAFYLLSIMNASSLVGRMAPNWLADKYDRPCLLSYTTLNCAN